MWIFGYGSLIFRPAFLYLERRAAYVTGYRRRFWQGSPDHRGTPESPGRVVTLLSAPGEACGGCAYRIDPAAASEILRVLDEREIAGFVRLELPLLDEPNGAVFAHGTTWVAGSDNPHYLGPLPEAEIAAHIRHSRGPSGANAEYVRLLATALVELGIEDSHVETIARLLEERVEPDR